MGLINVENHSLLGPSKASWYCGCNVAPAIHQYFLKIGALQPEKSSDAAERGNVAHDLAAKILKNEMRAEDLEEQFLPVLDYVYFVRQIDYDFEFVEERLDLNFILGGAKSERGEKVPLFGTSDFIGVKDLTLYVYDLKYGDSYPDIVYADNNHQLIMYALGALELLGCFEIEEIVLGIVQPNLNHIDTQRYRISDFYGMVDHLDIYTNVEIASRALIKVKNDDITLDSLYLQANAGQHCLFCLNLPICKRAGEELRDNIMHAFVAVDCGERDAVASALEIWRNERIYRKWLETIEEYLFDLTDKGLIEELKIVEGRRSRKHIDEKRSARFLRTKNLDNDVLYPRELITVAKAEALLDKESKKEFKKYYEVLPGKPVLAEISDKRPAIVKAAAVFENEEEN